MQAISTLFRLWSDRFLRSRRGFWVIEEKKKSPPEMGEDFLQGLNYETWMLSV